MSLIFAGLRIFSPALVLLASTAGAQELANVQLLTNRVLFAKEDAAQLRRVAEQRRIEELDRRAAAQAVQLQQQAASVQQLAGELRSIRDEREVIDLAQTFDSTIAAGRWPLARPLLADLVQIDLTGASETVASAPADSFIATLPTTVAKGGVLPRSNQRALVEGDRATLTSDGYAWSQPNRPRAPLEGRAGQYDYGFARRADGWKIDRLIFRPLPVAP